MPSPLEQDLIDAEIALGAAAVNRLSTTGPKQDYIDAFDAYGVEVLARTTPFQPEAEVDIPPAGSPLWFPITQ